jgi:nitroreductase
MQFLELAKQRYSVRAYKPDPVEDEKLAQVLEAARLAPTAANRQPYRLIVIRTRGREAELQRVYRQPWFVQAPLIIGVCLVPDEAWVRRWDGKNYGDVDVAIVFEHLILAAADLGLGTCWIGAFDAKAAREVLGIPETVVPMAFTPLGYPADKPSPKSRRPLDELVKYDRW